MTVTDFLKNKGIIKDGHQDLELSGEFGKIRLSSLLIQYCNEKDTNYWTPINSAPKDGTMVLVCIKSKDGKPVCVQEASFRAFHKNMKGKEVWRNEHGHKLKPTHFMDICTNFKH